MNDKSTTLSIMSDGRVATEDSDLRAVLKLPAHRLTEDEITALNYGYKNVYTEAHTEILNGKMVIFESSSNCDETGNQAFKVAFNHNPDGTEPFVPAEIYFKAKPDKYKKYIKAVVASIRTIQWDDKAHLVP